MFVTRDGRIALAPSDDAFFARLMDALDLSVLKTDPLYASQTARVVNRERINAIVSGKLAMRDTAHWVATLNAAGVPSGPVHSVAEVFADPQIQAQNMVLEVDHPGHGLVRLLGFPMKFAQAPNSVRLPAPDLGQHTDDVLMELGFTAEQRLSFRARKIV